MVYFINYNINRNVFTNVCNYHQVSKPNIGETRPSQVRADVTINLNMRDIVKAEWEGANLVW